MSTIYEGIGRLVVLFVATRFRSQLRIAGAASIAAVVLGAGAYIATRGGEEDLS